MKMVPSELILQNREKFPGLSPAWQQKPFFGEVVFTTGMTGYVESLTDPSYAGQILVFTYPLIGNYGVPDPSFWESSKIHAHGVVINELSPLADHYQARLSFENWLKEQKVALITQVDTRTLTRLLRSQGSVLGGITQKNKAIENFFNPNLLPLAITAGVREPRFYGEGKKRVIAVDCGMKENILRCLLRYPLSIKRVPADYDYSNEEFDGIFLSNGPGDPSLCVQTAKILAKAMQKHKPVFGICLGAQMMALAIGAKTFKLKYGHRGHNQPCQELKTGRCFLTSQNHGYAIEENTLPDQWEVFFRNLNDGTVEGIKHKTLPFFAVQFHPEAAPGPVDTEWLFEKFYHLL